MIRLVVLAPGVPVHAAAIAWCDDYRGRINRLAQFERKKVRPVRRTRAGPDPQACRRESAALVQAIEPGAFVVVLDVGGISIDCDQLCGKLQKTGQIAGRTIWFVLGGPDGFDQTVRARANEAWSLSPLTLPHELAEVVLMEQLYRALTRLHGLPYHR